MVITMITIRVVQVAFDKVINVIAVGHGRMSALWPVLMGAFMGAAIVLGRAIRRILAADLEFVLVDMIAVRVSEDARYPESRCGPRASPPRGRSLYRGSADELDGFHVQCS